MPPGEAVPPLMWVILPLACGLCAAVAAVAHYGAAVRGNAQDLPNLPMAMLGGAVSGFLSALLALIWVSAASKRLSHPFAIGILFSGLGGEYFGGRCDDVATAARAGLVAAVVLLPVGVWLMGILR